MKKKYSAFTLAEVLVTMTILGVAMALTIPSIASKRPNEEMMRFKKAYSTVESTVVRLMDPRCFDLDSDNPQVFASSSVAASFPQCPASGATKFCVLFADTLNAVGAVSCGTALDAAGNGSFRTTDGITWAIASKALVAPVPPAVPTTNSSSAAIGTDALEIWVDVNPSAKSTNTSGGAKPDRFRLWVRYDGKVIVPAADTVAINYLKNSSPSFRCKSTSSADCL